MPSMYKRRQLASRYDDCGRIHNTSSGASWNSSTVVWWYTPVQSTNKFLDALKDEKANKYDQPDAMHFSEWVRSVKGATSADGEGSTLSASSKMDSKSWPSTTASSNKVNSPNPLGNARSQNPKGELCGRRAWHKKGWNHTTALSWKNTNKREQFRNIMDGRRMPKSRNEKYKNVQPQYLKPRKRYDIVPPNPEKTKIYRPKVFPLATQCKCDDDAPKSACPLACPLGFLPACIPLCTPLNDDSRCCFRLRRPVHYRPSIPKPIPRNVLRTAIGAHEDDGLNAKCHAPSEALNAKSDASSVQHEAPRQSSPSDAPKQIVAVATFARPSTDATHSSSRGEKLHDARPALVTKEPDSKPETASEVDRTDTTSLAAHKAVIEHVAPHIGHEFEESKELFEELENQQVWNFGGGCWVRFPCLGGNGMEDDS